MRVATYASEMEYECVEMTTRTTMEALNVRFGSNSVELCPMLTNFPVITEKFSPNSAGGTANERAPFLFWPPEVCRAIEANIMS